MGFWNGTNSRFYGMTVFGWIYPILMLFILIAVLIVLILFAIYLYRKIDSDTNSKEKK